MEDERVRTYAERYGYEPSEIFKINALERLLIAEPYHPGLWPLYSVNRALRFLKPSFAVEKRVEIYSTTSENELWFHGDLYELRDLVISLDSRTCAVSLMTSLRREWYTVPREWCKRLVVRRDEKNRYWFHLLPIQFCCRQILKSKGVGVIQCRSMLIRPENYVDSAYFHVGLGKCWKSIHEVYESLHCFVGLKQLAAAIDKMDIFDETERNFPYEIIYILGMEILPIPYEYFAVEEIEVEIEAGKKEKSSIVHVSVEEKCGQTLRGILMHILVCAQCNMFLDGFLKLIHKSLMKYDPLQGYTFFNITNTAGLHRGYVNTVKYTLDGDFDQLLLDAYNAPKERCMSVKNFMCKYF
jgi:hypothetical protein